MVCDLATNKNKCMGNTEFMILPIIILIWNNHYYLDLNIRLSDDSKK